MIFDNSNISFSNSDIGRGIILPRRLTSELAELFGIMVGDGCIHLRESPPNRIKYEILIYGHSEEDLDYHNLTTSNLFYKLFKIKPYIRDVYGKNAIKICVTSKAITSFLIKKMGFISGNKIKNACGIPQYFFKVKDKTIVAALIRGIADTDFYLVFKIRKDTKFKEHHYPLIAGQFASRALTEQLKELLNELGIHSHLEKGIRKLNNKLFRHYRVVVVGKKNLEKWINLIGFSNPKHYTKYLVWKKFGFCPPRTTLAERRKILKGIVNINSISARGEVANINLKI